MSKEVEPRAVMTFLNQLFTLFDRICDVHGVQKVETAGESETWCVELSMFWGGSGCRRA